MGIRILVHDLLAIKIEILLLKLTIIQSGDWYKKHFEVIDRKNNITNQIHRRVC